MQFLTSCWRLVDWQNDNLDLASRVSSILLELCELEVLTAGCLLALCCILWMASTAQTVCKTLKTIGTRLALGQVGQDAK